MFALLATLVLSVPAGQPGSLDVVTDEVGSNTNGNSSLSIPATELGDPSQKTSGPRLEDPPNVAPEISYAYAEVSQNSILSLEGDVTDEDLPGITVTISWLDDEYEVGVNSAGHFSWQIELSSSQSGYLTAVATDSAGADSEPWRDLIYP